MKLIRFGPILTMSTIVIILLLYIYGVISNTWINRAGIVMNFVAGFMLAPELLGEGRLAKAEAYLVGIFDSTNQAFNSRTAYLNKIASDNMMMFLVNFIFGIVPHNKQVLFTKEDGEKLTYTVRFRLRRSKTIFYLLLWLSMIPIRKIVNLSTKVSIYLLSKLIGNDRLKSTLVWWGIIFFIIGNALQFAATFTWS